MWPLLLAPKSLQKENRSPESMVSGREQLSGRSKEVIFRQNPAHFATERNMVGQRVHKDYVGSAISEAALIVEWVRRSPGEYCTTPSVGADGDINVCQSRLTVPFFTYQIFARVDNAFLVALETALRQ